MSTVKNREVFDMAVSKGNALGIVALIGAILMIVGVFMVWVEFYTWADLVSGTLSGWEALTEDRWAELEDMATEKDYHLLPGWLIGLSAVSAVMFVAGHLAKRRGAKVVAYVIPMLFGIALIYGIKKLLEQMGTHYYVLHVDAGIGVWAALAASIIVIAVSFVSMAHAATMRGRKNVPVD